MTKIALKTIGTVFMLCVFGIFTSCNEKANAENLVLNSETMTETVINFSNKPPFEQSEEFISYWYAGEAEISSYQLEQVRYGEIHDGSAVLVYVTEDFLPEKQVKADNFNTSNISVLKLNATKKFNTGIYPYSIMQSTFYPVSNTKHAIKVSCSVQEWCGHAYTQLNNKDQFEIKTHSYFEREADQNVTLDKTILENELWAQLRLDPKSLPLGELNVIPSMEFIRLKHIECRAYKAIAVLKSNNYSITYPELGRTLNINFNMNFPFDILGWEETYKDGYGINAAILTTKATKLKTIKSAYWRKNSNADETLRETLQLK
ncbi:hypothetical protein SAMN04515667_1541 [Formosa sp. Hel1_31_208]|uniref:septum formation inhibitor Maf n=1 Tax=Formosa sp. Hel1_31_208 TaxID=1798225 RepID=UPI00087D8275|nr:septum formation inhibitor Maf [Formosa sp. Hel1_31_208]SDS15844.1 hypothetical protein SAMN04515667_1541 [Formosa sp. Hel1_31_208]